MPICRNRCTSTQSTKSYTTLPPGTPSGVTRRARRDPASRFALVALVMPATLDHIRKISQAGERMPAKSTYFYPKLLSGLTFHLLSS